MEKDPHIFLNCNVHSFKKTQLQPFHITVFFGTWRTLFKTKNLKTKEKS